jgi:hypothetical protein
MNIIARFFLNLLRFFLSFLFVLSLSSFIIVWTLADFSQKSNIKPLMSEVIYQELNRQMDAYSEEQLKRYVSTLCANKENVETTISGIDLKISCKDFFVANDLKKFFAESIAESFYEASYSCEVIECLNEERYDVLVSRKGNEFYNQAFLPLIAASALSGLAIFTLEEGKLSKRIKTIAVLILVVCLPAIAINFLREPIKQRFISYSEIVDKIVENLLAIAFKKYLLAFIFGISLLAISLFLWLIERRQNIKQVG